jgi:hypothetical protein
VGFLSVIYSPRGIFHILKTKRGIELLIHFEVGPEKTVNSGESSLKTLKTERGFTFKEGRSNNHQTATNPLYHLLTATPLWQIHPDQLGIPIPPFVRAVQYPSQNHFVAPIPFIS